MLKLKLLEIVNAKSAFENLIKLHFPMTVAFSLAKRLRTINVELEAYNLKLDELVKTYGEELPDKPGSIGIQPGMKNFTEWKKLHIELLEVEVELALDPISLKWLNDEATKTKKGVENALNVADAMMLLPFMVD